jgi:hypothetical protein
LISFKLEEALHAADDAQASLRRERENARATLCSEEEFKSLQAQVQLGCIGSFIPQL